jgi:hypothetical protein
MASFEKPIRFVRKVSKGMNSLGRVYVFVKIIFIGSRYILKFVIEFFNLLKQVKIKINRIYCGKTERKYGKYRLKSDSG